MLFAFMIIAMNGFQESDAEWGIYLFTLWAAVGALFSAVSSYFGVSYLVNRKKINVYLAGLISILIFSVVGGIVNSVGVVAGLITAEVVRTGF